MNTQQTNNLTDSASALGAEFQTLKKVPFMKHFVADHQLTKAQIEGLITLAKDIKSSTHQYKHVLAGKSVAMIFEKPSLRTLVSFDIGINKLGGHAVNIGQKNGKLGERERVKDYAKNLSCYADFIVARVYEHDSILDLAEYANIPIINALCDKYHPCQALADFVTLSEYFSDLSQLKLAYVGDANNVSNSLMTLAAIMGIPFTLICPKGHGPSLEIIEQTQFLYEQSQLQDSSVSSLDKASISTQSPQQNNPAKQYKPATLTISHDMADLGQQDVIYTDTWISMGDSAEVNEQEKAAVLEKFSPYQVNHEMLIKAGANKVMHCQPAHLEQEISTALFDDPSRSIVFQQAENRMWAQCAILTCLSGATPSQLNYS